MRASNLSDDATREPAIAVVDLGGQYCHLITRRLRDLRVRSRIVPAESPASSLRGYAGIILSGGPNSVYEAGAPAIDPELLELGVPVLGICYGHQLLAKLLGADVKPGAMEYGPSTLSVVESDSLFDGTPRRQRVWMSHSDSVGALPPDIRRLARTERCEVAAFADPRRQVFGVQFHPEVTHSDSGKEVLRNFTITVCGLTPETDPAARLQEVETRLRAAIGDRSVFFLVSGGVDSSVAFALCARVLRPERLLGLYVDTGLMRKGETEELRANFARLGLLGCLKVRDESARFLAALAGVVEPERKRHIIGRLFVEVQAEAMREYGIGGDGWLLGQGTIYPDTIESGGASGKAAVIKTHHNRCAEIVELLARGQVIEPLAEFYKDEVREIGRAIGLDDRLTHRWPFPGPGLAIRCLCAAEDAATPGKRLPLAPGYGPFEAVRFPLRSVGVQGDGRTYRDVVALAGPLDYPRLQQLGSELCNANTEHNRVMVLLTGHAGALRDGRVVHAHLTEPRLRRLREADAIVRSTLEESGLTDSVWQFPVISIPLSFGGGETIVLRPVNSTDGMTANFARLPQDLLLRLAGEIGDLPGVDAVFLDCTDKPPGTIEWE
jgi:GMP synthase (glutamine-hydrolysing)